MKSRWTSIFWAIMLILAGVVAILDGHGIINLDLVPVRIMAFVFAALSAFFFLTYILRGTQQWGWLFPAFILAGIALVMWLEDTALGSLVTGAPVLIGIALPFFVVFFTDVKKNWWALIPAWVLAAIALVVLFENRVDDNLVGSFILFNIALPFLWVFLTDKTRRWALIPAGVLAVVGLIPLLENLLSGDLMGFAVMALFSVVFFVVYFMTKTSWWALIPAGIFASIALVVLLSMTLPMATVQFDGGSFNPLGTSILLTGFAATFGVLWLRRAVHPTEWARFPALALFALALVSLLAGDRTQALWPLALIAAGSVVLVGALLKKKS